MSLSALERDLRRLEAELKQLEAQYNMFFAGRLATPPWETRARVEALVTRCDRAHILNTADRFRFTTLQARFVTFVDLWDRGLKAREEGRPGPFARVRPPTQAARARPADRLLRVAAFRDPAREADKLKELYESLAEARREVGDTPVSFQEFAKLVKTQVNKLRQTGIDEVAFRVAFKAGKVAFTARGLRGARGVNGEGQRDEG